MEKSTMLNPNLTTIALFLKSVQKKKEKKEGMGKHNDQVMRGNEQ